MNMRRKPGDIVGKVSFICYLTKPKARFKCFCGKEFEARIGDVRRGNTGCGCRKTGAGHPQYKHGNSPKSKVSLSYSSWKSAKARCSNPNGKKYHIYGGAGVIVCGRWANSFENFLIDMGERPSVEYTLDRFPNRKGNYEPGNCRWATIEQQNLNRNDNIRITFNGETKTMIEWSKETGIHKNTLNRRYHSGWGVDKMLTITPNKSLPRRRRNRACYNHPIKNMVINAKILYEKAA